MESFIALAADKLDLDTPAVERTLGIFFLILREDAPRVDFQRFIAGLQGAEKFLVQADTELRSTEGVLGLTANFAGNAMGGKAWKLGAFAHLEAAGLSSEQLGALLELFEVYASIQLEPALIERLVEHILNPDGLIA